MGERRFRSFFKRKTNLKSLPAMSPQKQQSSWTIGRFLKRKIRAADLKSCVFWRYYTLLFKLTFCSNSPVANFKNSLILRVGCTLLWQARLLRHATLWSVGTLLCIALKRARIGKCRWKRTFFSDIQREGRVSNFPILVKNLQLGT